MAAALAGREPRPVGLHIRAVRLLAAQAKDSGAVSTADVCAKVVLPLTRERCEAYTATLGTAGAADSFGRREGARSDGGRGECASDGGAVPPLTAPATHFVSHAWSCRFDDLVAVLEEVAGEAAAGKTAAGGGKAGRLDGQHQASPKVVMKGNTHRGVLLSLLGHPKTVALH